MKLTHKQAAILARCVDPRESKKPGEWFTLFSKRDTRTLEVLERRGLITRQPLVPQSGRLVVLVLGILLIGCTHPPTRSQVLEQVRDCINAPGAVGLLRDIVDDCTTDVVVVTVARAECLDEFEMYSHADSLKADAQCERVGR